MKQRRRHLLVIHYAPDSLRDALQKLRRREEYADLGLLILAPEPRRYEADWAAAGIPCRIIECDFKDDNRLRELLEPFCEDIAAVICRGDKYIQYLRRVIPHLPPDVAVASPASLAAATNKHLMRTSFARHHPEITPAFLQVSDASPSTIRAIEQSLRYPVIVKPAHLASSLLIQSCQNRQELQAALTGIVDRIAEVYRREEREEPPQIIVEEYLEGEFYSVDAYVLEPGDVYFCPPVAYVPAKQLGIDDFFLYKRFLPTALTPADVRAANEVTAKAIKSVGLTHCTVHVELIHTRDGWKVIEVGPRLGRFRSTMYDQAYGIDHSLNDILIHLGEKPRIPLRSLRYCATYSIYPEQEGVLRELKNIQAVKHSPLVVYLRILAEPGDMCRYASRGGHALAEFVIAAEDEATYTETVRFIEENVKAVVDPVPPRVRLIRALTVSQESAASSSLAYPFLEEEIQRVAPTMQATEAVAGGNPMAQERGAEQLTMYELLATARAIQRAATEHEEAELCRRFTRISTELFGAPERQVACGMAFAELERLRQIVDLKNSAEFHLLETGYALLGAPPGTHAPGDPWHNPAWTTRQSEKLAARLGRTLHTRYADVFGTMPPGKKLFTAQEAAHLFKAVLNVLAAQGAAWDGWSVVMDQTSKLSVNSSARQVQVGMHRAPMSRAELEGLIAHEILVHARRSVNGSKTGVPALAGGLPGYTTSEEGLGVLFELALTGVIPQKISDRYVDVALALQGLPRKRLLALVCARARLRARASGTPIDDARITHAAWAHVNRIYRGTRGGKIVGVFTKDAAYYTGFIRMLRYMTEQLKAGRNINELLDILLAAKFDPTDPRHAAFVAEHLRSDIMETLKERA